MKILIFIFLLFPLFILGQSRNEIKRIHEEQLRLSLLQQLKTDQYLNSYWDEIKIEDPDRYTEYLKRLKTLILTDNPLENTKGIQRLKKLESLTLNKTIVPLDPYSIVKCNMLKKLNMNECQLMEIPVKLVE